VVCHFHHSCILTHTLFRYLHYPIGMKLISDPFPSPGNHMTASGLTLKSPQFGTIDDTPRFPGTLYNFLSLASHKLILSQLRAAFLVSCHCLHGHTPMSGTTLCLVTTGENTLIMLPCPPPPFLYPFHPPVAGDSTILPSASPSCPFNE